MKATIDRSILHGNVFSPPSKSYTHRAVVMSALSNRAIVHNPLLSADTLATVKACQALGAGIQQENQKFIINGVRGSPALPNNVIDVANSGTTLRLITAVSALCNGSVVLTGDDSIRTRPNTPLIKALNQLGAEVFS